MTKKAAVVIIVLLLTICGIYFLYASFANNKSEAKIALNSAIYIMSNHCNIAFLDPIDHIYNNIDKNHIDAQVSKLSLQDKLKYAATRLEAAKALDPSLKYAYAYLGEVYSLLCGIAIRENRKDKLHAEMAISNLKMAIDNGSSLGKSYIYLFTLYRENGQFDSAIKTAIAAQEKRIFMGQPWDYAIGLIYLDTGKYQECISLGTLMLHNESASTFGNHLLGMCYYMADQNELSDYHFGEYLKSKPNEKDRIKKTKSAMKKKKADTQQPK